MTLLGFKELVSEEIGKQGQELQSLIDFNLIASSRENYLIYLRWLTPIWVYLETQIEASPLADRKDFDLSSKFRSPLLASDYHALLGTNEALSANLLPTTRIFDETPSLGTAAGMLYVLEDIQLDHKDVKRRLTSIGIRGKSVTQFYRGTQWAKSRRSEKLGKWIDTQLTARERLEAIEGAHLSGVAFIEHFTRFRNFLDNLPSAATSLTQPV